MNETFLNRNKKIDFIKKTPSFYNFIYLKELIYLLNKPVSSDANLVSSHNKYFEDINEKFFNSVPKGIVTESNLEKFKIFLNMYYDKSLDNNNTIIFNLNLDYYLEHILKLPKDDYVGDFFSLINNEENLIILPCSYNSDIKSLREYFISINFEKLNFFTTKTKKQIDYFNNSNTIKTNPFFNKFMEMIDDYDSKNKKNIYYLPCITSGGITNEDLNSNLDENIDNINKIINNNYDEYMTEYGRKSSISKLGIIYKNIYTFFDNENDISIKLLYNIVKNKKNNKSIMLLNNDFLKKISNYDNKNFRRIIVQEKIEKIRNIDINYYVETSNYLKNKDINNVFSRLRNNIFSSMAANTNNEFIKNSLSNPDNKKIKFNKNSNNYEITINILCKCIYLYLFFCIKNIHNNKKIESLQTEKYNLKKLNIKYSMDTKNNNNNKIFDVRYLTLPMDATKTKKSYVLNFFNYKSIENIPLYIINNFGPFNKLYMTDNIVRKLKSLIPEISNKQTLKNKKKNLNNDILFFIRLLYVYGIKSPNQTDILDVNNLKKLKKIIFNNNFLKNFEKKDNIDLLIKIDKIENINSFKIYLHNVKYNSYIEIKNLNGFLTEKNISKINDINTFNISNIINKTVSDNIYYYNNFLIKPKNLKSYLNHKNLSDNLSIELLKILSDRNILEDFYIYNYLDDNLKKDYINKKNEIIIINNIIKIIFSKNQPFTTYVSKERNTIQSVYTINSELYKYKIEDVSSLQNRLEQYPQFIINEKSNYYLYTDSKNKQLLENIKNKEKKEFYKKDVIIKNAPDNNYAIIKLELTENLKTNINSVKNLTCKDKKASIYEKVKKYFDFNIIKNNITKKRIQYFGMGGSNED